MAAQDMPPPGGFASIPVKRTFAKPVMRQGLYATAIVALSFIGIYRIRQWRKRISALRVEQTESYIAVQPFLVAEQERKFLRHLRNVREDERELMKNVPGWIVGTLYGEKVFKTVPANEIPPINVNDYIVHRTRTEFIDHVWWPDHHS